MVYRRPTTETPGQASSQQGLSSSAKDSVYSELTRHILAQDKNVPMFIAGDFSGHVGKTKAGYPQAHGGLGYGGRNTEDERLLEFCTPQDMSATQLSQRIQTS